MKHEPLSNATENSLLNTRKQTNSIKPVFAHQIFEKNITHYASYDAVIFEEDRISYTALNAKANQLAHYLMQRGVMPDTLVGLCIERSIGMLIAILAIWKSGGAYLPIDPDY